VVCHSVPETGGKYVVSTGAGSGVSDFSQETSNVRINIDERRLFIVFIMFGIVGVFDCPIVNGFNFCFIVF
jgi:hypothetical protein